MPGLRIGLLVALCGSAAGVRAQDGAPDAAVTDALRWADPRGTASGGLASTALPATRALREVWKLELPADLVAAPVVWEGRVFLLCRVEGDRMLFGVDLFRGLIVAKKRLAAGPDTQPAVWNDRVVLRETPETYAEFKLVGKGFNRVWVHRPEQGTLTDPVVFENEIYGIGQGRLFRLASGRARPVWKGDQSLVGSLRGRPAVYGEFVYCVGDHAQPGYEESMHLYAISRRTGLLAASTNVAWYAGRRPPPLRIEAELTVTPDEVHIRAPAPLAAKGGVPNFASVAHEQAEGGVRLGEPIGLHRWACAPAVHRKGVVVLGVEQQSAWLLWRGSKGVVLAERRTHPDLFAERVAPTVLGDVVYFGNWAADIETLEVLWRLPVRSLAYPVIPADRSLLAVEGRRTLRFFRVDTDA